MGTGDPAVHSSAPIPVVQHGGVHGLGGHREEGQQPFLPTLQGFLWGSEELRGHIKCDPSCLRNLNIMCPALPFFCQITFPSPTLSPILLEIWPHILHHQYHQ